LLATACRHLEFSKESVPGLKQRPEARTVVQRPARRILTNGQSFAAKGLKVDLQPSVSKSSNFDAMIDIWIDDLAHGSFSCGSYPTTYL
jgi:hypothetical protein